MADLTEARPPATTRGPQTTGAPTTVPPKAATGPAERPPASIRVGRSLLRFLRSRASGWTLVALVIVFWQISSEIHFNPTISAPDRIAQTWLHEITQGQLLPDLGRTLRTMAIGFALAVPLGVGIGFLMGRSRIVWGLLEPTVEVLRLTPTTAILPIFVLFLGIGESMKIAVFLAAGIFPMIINAYAGARGVSKVLNQTAQTYRLTWWQTQREIALPYATPFILVGMRQSLGISLVLAVVVGMLAGNDGIGFYILNAQQTFNINQLLAAVVTVAFVGYVFNSIFLLAERRTTRWRRIASGE
ncbi:ABC transporter permease [Dactylosporangium sp. NPDC051484]|uniref:ABC transporter permease n=1 Tax=Dactylosporangium sp. NPDC051484 TaxID=3154942 RepID=UPI003450CA5E